MTSNMPCTSSKDCDIEELLCALDQNTNSYKCKPNAFVPRDTRIIYHLFLPRYPSKERKTYDQTSQPPPSQKGLYARMKLLDVGKSCVSDEQCFSNNCENSVCTLINESAIRKQSVIAAVKNVQFNSMCSTQRLSIASTTSKTNSIITINGENITDGPYFGDQNPYILPLHRSSNSFTSDHIFSLFSNQHSHERRYTPAFLPIIPQATLRNSPEEWENGNSFPEKRTNGTLHPRYSPDERTPLDLVENTFNECPPPAYLKAEK
ncbi:17634_t:CDS:2 [Acaulospora colombiana]|uniref:17634_t:CDS:1 n=1 Tax=Acaulospora colombiana TaxID=27376 RepID=A0ACA9KJ46_9GLOM|nr:17634_t:CDS:2 [Acaulospora colombiana]